MKPNWEKELAWSDNGNFYIGGQNVTKEEFEREKDIQERLQQARQEGIEAIDLQKLEEEAQKFGAEKYGTYNYDFMEGVFFIKFAIADKISELKKKK